jgi:hypothetical protein
MTIAFLVGMFTGSGLALLFFDEIYREQKTRIGDLSRALEETAVALRVEEAINAIGEDDQLIGEIWLDEIYERSAN